MRAEDVRSIWVIGIAGDTILEIDDFASIFEVLDADAEPEIKILLGNNAAIS